MAIIFPESLSKDRSDSDPERQVFDLLRELPDHFTIIHSKKFKGGLRSKEETEIDFLIFDGRKNLICLEVKGGEVAFNAETGRWFQNGSFMDRSPDRQATSATRAVIEFLAPLSGSININWALAFPQCCRPSGSGRIPEVPDDLILDATALLDVGSAVGKICRYNEERFRREGVSRHQAAQVMERLLRSVGFITKIGVRIIRETRQLLRVTEQQMEVLEDLEVNRRIAVMGFAGTGKTVLAQEYAKRLEARGKDVLLLFFNRMIANAVRYGFERGSEVRCETFHGLARRIIDRHDPTWWKRHSKNTKTEDSFWSEEVPLRLLEVSDKELQKFDAIIVDEGQDFKSDWFEILTRLLKEPTAGRFAVFYDENQDIFGRWKDLPWGSDGIARKVLRRNCRNTKTIVNYLNGVLPTEMVAFDGSPTGEEIKLRLVSSDAEEAAAIKADVETLLRGGVEPGSIVILVDRPFAESNVSRIERVRTYPVQWMGRTYRDSEKAIQVSSIQSFKGLEASVVLLAGVVSARDGSDRFSIYTKASRAKNLLYIYERVESKKELIDERS